MDTPRIGFAGVDVRGGLHGNPSRPRRGENIYFDDDFGAHMRPPVASDGTLDAYRDGLVYLDGQWYTFADDNVVDSDHGIAGVEALLINVPPACYPYDWILADATVFAGHVCALIWHPRQMGSAEYRLYLHVWDNKVDQPTWVSDPAAQFNWKRPWPLHVGSAQGIDPWGTLSDLVVGPNDYQPRMVEAGEKLWVTLPNGDMACCAIGNPRTWNDRTFDEIAADGEMWYIWTGGDITVTGYTLIPVDGASLSLIVGDWVGFTVERWDESTETWVELIYTSNFAAVSSGYWSINYETYSKWPNGQHPYMLQWKASYNTNTLLRFRAVAGESPVHVVDGGNLYVQGDVVPIGVSSGTSHRWETDLRYDDARCGCFELYAIDPDGVAFPLGAFTQSPKKWDVETRDADGVERANILMRLFRGVVSSTASDYTTTVPNTVWGAQAGLFASNFAYVVVINGTLVDTSTYSIGANGGYLQITLTTGTFTAGDEVELCYAPITGSTVELRAATAGIGSATIRRGTESQEVNALKALASGQGWVDGAGNLVGYRWDESLPVVEQSTPLNTGLDVRYFATVEINLDSYVRIERWKRYAYPDNELDINEWFTDKKLRYINEMAGADQTTIKATSNYEPNGEQIRTLAAVKDKLVVGYPSSVQFWHIDPLPVNDRKLDEKNIGMHGDLVEVSGMLMTLTAGGFRGLQPQGLNWDALSDSNVGESLEGIGDITWQAGAWWPHFGLFVCAGSLTPSAIGTRYGYAAGLHFFVLRFSATGTVISWSNWRCAALASVDKLIPAGDQLYVVSGKSRYRFDGGAASFRDVGATAYDATLLLPFDAFGRLGKGKVLRSLELEMDGGCDVKMHLLPQNATHASQAMTVGGRTWGANPLQLGAMCSAVALELVANEATGWDCFGYQWDWTPLGR